MNSENRLRKQDWRVGPAQLSLSRDLVVECHYAKGASNTATYLHGLYRKSDGLLCGVAWWIPPTKSAAKATYSKNWRGVLSLSRLAVRPEVPKNACSFLISRSMKIIDRERWPCLVTYADEWQGHSGAIYLAANWTPVGRTTPEATYVVGGRMVSRKAGPTTRTVTEMKALGAQMVGRHAKRKFVHLVETDIFGRPIR